jgi:hypothetical protein
MAEYDEAIQELTHEDCHKTIHEFTGAAETSYGFCQAVLPENLDMHHTATKFVPLLLTNDQKQ